MKVKILTDIETAYHTAERDGHGGFDVKKVILHLKGGDTVDLDEELAERLKKQGFASEDPNAPLGSPNLKQVQEPAPASAEPAPQPKQEAPAAS